MGVNLQGGTLNPQAGAVNPQPVAKKPLQAPTFAVQRTAPASVLDSPAPAVVVPTASDVAAAAASLRIVQAQEVARQKQVAGLKIQSKIDTSAAQTSASTKLAVSSPTWKGKLLVGKGYKLPTITLPVQTDYQREYAKAYAQALSDFKQQSQPSKKGFFGNALDKVTFGQDRRDSSARSYAAKKANDISNQKVSDYEKVLNAFLKDQAAKKANIEATKFASQTEFEKAVTDYTSWENQNINQLEASRAQITALLDAYGQSSQAPLNSSVAHAAGWLNQKLAHGLPGKALGSVWNYTLGQGSKNVPSVVTAPSRLVNWLGNLNTKNRTIYQSGGSTINRGSSSLNAWQASFNQRNLNTKPVVVPTFSLSEAEKKFGSQLAQLQKSGGYKGLSHNDGLRRMWDSFYKQSKFRNSAQEVISDPLNSATGGVAVARKTGFLKKLAVAGRSSSLTSGFFKASDKLSSVQSAVASSKLVKWLGSEAKTPEQVLSDAIDQAKKNQAGLQTSLFPRINQINKKLAGDSQLDTSVFTDLSSLSDSEAKILQRMTAGKLSNRDRLFLAGSNMKPVRDRLEAVAVKWQNFTEQMKLADNVRTTRFGAGKRTYSPATAWLPAKNHRLADYNFRLFKKNTAPQSKSDFLQGSIDRYFKSSLDQKHAFGQSSKANRLKLERQALLARYDSTVGVDRAAIDRAYQKTRSPYNRLRKTVSAPTRLWKKSVLKYRPAWTANNVIYNTQAATLAGGSRALVEQARMLSPRYWRKAFDQVPADVKTNLAREIGGRGKLNKFYSGVENWSRVAAFRAAKRRGLSDAEALARVNKYLFDYKTKNWERPIKSVVPFWQFQKNLAKAGSTMPLDRPVAAQAYNRLDRYQQQQYDREFASLVPELRKLGYSDSEIGKMKEENAKYFRGRLKVGNKWFTTPFNAFSEKGMSQLGFNPFLTASGEAATATDSFNQSVKGKDASFWHRLVSKFPQADLVSQKLSKPTREGWISKPTTEGYGLTKQKQGLDPSKPNYVRSLDPSVKLGQNTLAFLGLPRSLVFNKQDFLQGKRLQKATADYFSNDWQSMDYPEQQQKQAALFAKYGLTADQFFKGILAKYDTENTKRIKNLKADAAVANKSLFDEYSKQPIGSRNQWATKKLRELVASGYFKDNPFLKSFKWTSPTTVSKASRQSLYQDAKRSGDWSKWVAAYGDTRKHTTFTYQGKFFKTAASRDKYVAGQASHTFWQKYQTESSPVVRRQLLRDNPQFAKKPVKSEAEISQSAFWWRYASASPSERKQLLKDNPQYNTRSSWSRAQWTAWKRQKSSVNLVKSPSLSSSFSSFKTTNQVRASRFLSSKTRKAPNIKWGLHV